MELEGAEIRAFEVEHSVRACGYALVEHERPGRFDLEAAKRLGVPEGPAFAALQRGEAVTGAAGRVGPEQVVGEARPGRTIAITGDTGPCEATVEAARGAELLVHDASFSEEEAQRALDTGHSTIGQAAAVAREAQVKMLAAVHISSRYHVGAVLEEARKVFEPTVAPRDFDLIEIPFPERGNPKLVPNGARDRGRDRNGTRRSSGRREAEKARRGARGRPGVVRSFLPRHRGVIPAPGGGSNMQAAKRPLGSGGRPPVILAHCYAAAVL